MTLSPHHIDPSCIRVHAASNHSGPKPPPTHDAPGPPMMTVFEESGSAAGGPGAAAVVAAAGTMRCCCSCGCGRMLGRSPAEHRLAGGIRRRAAGAAAPIAGAVASSSASFRVKKRTRWDAEPEPLPAVAGSSRWSSSEDCGGRRWPPLSVFRRSHPAAAAGAAAAGAGAPPLPLLPGPVPRWASSYRRHPKAYCGGPEATCDWVGRGRVFNTRLLLPSDMRQVYFLAESMRQCHSVSSLRLNPAASSATAPCRRRRAAAAAPWLGPGRRLKSPRRRRRRHRPWRSRGR